ncbi:S-acyl fatty acid synthase thioesterase, medium chain [Hondaea fermentalgiana]|uniref:S-acyl fatty acid synthase thioesterase, medium chain n=1 Tax=Hondaea fermentalgiana TaxID=2315210 RepID=A0A2R5G3G8_9STRA|nr:S-acyl fatty acid synthase thioesterase, medium chain [Hondaea fermentalgiana]|eukprot:GBG25075.1 S-acyl fatty acid synthase thioesterase, medium chain [Hondaea fermentalgiana]
MTGPSRVRLEVLASAAPGQALVFFFPWAGGNLAHPSVRALAKDLAAKGHATTIGVSLPGRLARAKEPVYRSFTELVPDVAREVRQLLRKQACAPRAVVFFGYSLGSQVAWQTLETLLNPSDVDKAGNDSFDLAAWPVRLVVAASRAPQNLLGSLPKVKEMSDSAFLEYISAKGGTPKEVLDHAAFRALILPPLRADYELLETFSFSESPAGCSRDTDAIFGNHANVSLKALYGNDLETMDVLPWAGLVGAKGTTASDNKESSTSRWLGAQHFAEDGHFFLFENVASVADALAATFPFAPSTTPGEQTTSAS